MDINSEPVSFCQRLFDFIICKLNPPTSPPDSDLTIEFNHTDTGLENRAQTIEPTTVQKGPEEKDKQQDRGKRPKKSVTFQESAGDGETGKKKGGDEAKHEPNDRSHEDTNPRPPRHWGPLLSVASNINEKSDAFIRTRKKKMGRNYSLDQDRKS